MGEFPTAGSFFGLAVHQLRRPCLPTTFTNASKWCLLAPLLYLLNLQAILNWL